MTLTLQQIKDAIGPRTKDVEVHEFGGSVRIKKVGAPGFIAIQQLSRPDPNDKAGLFEYFLNVCRYGTETEDGQPLFATDDDVAVLRDLPLVATRLGKEIIEFNHLNRSDGDSKNSGGQPPESSGTG